MSYDHEALASRIVALLEQRPALSAEAIARHLGVHRQTVTKVLRGRVNRSFKAYQCDRVYSALRDLHANGRHTSWKLVADELGCSTRSLNRWLVRYRHLNGTRLRGDEL